MECKYYFENGQWDDGDELIDTLWNVNLCMMPYSCHAEFRINRYIMECKLKTLIVPFWKAKELIDTLWNVNHYRRMM